MSGRLRRGVSLVVLGAVFVAASSSIVSAETLSSNNYKFDESTLGSGGLNQSSSSSYQSSSALGDLAIGNSASENYQVEAGNKTTNDPTLSFAINNASASFGSFSATTSATATATFSISNYTSYGYVVQIAGEPPKNGTHTITPLPTETSPQVGTKQFGINLVANTAPASVGANPSHGLFAVGNAAPSYSTPNKYRYVSGETIATSPASSGVTTYTMTYMVNVDSLMVGGQYTTNQTLIVTGTY